MNEKKRFLLNFWSKRSTRGQAFIETILLFPVLIVLLSGLVELGFLINDYMALQDATRNAARFGAGGIYDTADSVSDCDSTGDYFRQIGCSVNQELHQERPEVALNIANGGDDVVVSVFSVIGGGGGAQVVARFPLAAGESGWSMAEDTVGYATRNQVSRITTDWVEGRLITSAPNTGFVVVEVFYFYQQKMNLPWITIFSPDSFLLRTYAVMPNSSAEPTPTPEGGSP